MKFIYKYIKNNLEYEKIRIFNSYNNGSYLMLNNIPVFIDSRLDVYCSEFNDPDIFYDFIQASTGNINYNEIITFDLISSGSSLSSSETLNTKSTLKLSLILCKSLTMPETAAGSLTHASVKKLSKYILSRS